MSNSVRIDVSLEQTGDYEFRIRFDGSAVDDLITDEPAAQYQNLERILAQFENFCVVTQSVRAGIAVAVRVCDAKGMTVHEV
ncbi:MAG: hypothetical protein CVV14_09180 [Gammaproteobacteria bacterium HGW-Gammaproteobacteria-4]|jgi:hypothetical protein|nr:MAG: hypothetical protein CVV14_09180 [Gammaproteobacteria bacterium HGW-Gammaproteobacteria-4]